MADNPADPTLTTLIATFKEADEEYKSAQARRAKCKTLARGLVEVGVGSPEQKAEVDELMPVITRERKAAEGE